MLRFLPLLDWPNGVGQAVGQVRLVQLTSKERVLCLAVPVEGRAGISTRQIPLLAPVVVVVGNGLPEAGEQKELVGGRAVRARTENPPVAETSAERVAAAAEQAQRLEKTERMGGMAGNMEQAAAAEGLEQVPYLAERAVAVAAVWLLLSSTYNGRSAD